MNNTKNHRLWFKFSSLYLFYTAPKRSYYAAIYALWTIKCDLWEMTCFFSEHQTVYRMTFTPPNPIYYQVTGKLIQKGLKMLCFLPFVSAIALMYSLMSTLNWFSAESSSTLRVEQTWYQRLNWSRPSTLVPAHSSLKYLYLQTDNLNAVLYKYCNKHALSLTHTYS